MLYYTAARILQSVTSAIKNWLPATLYLALQKGHTLGKEPHAYPLLVLEGGLHNGLKSISVV